MGSYCSILNDTEDVWSVKLGPDEAAVNIASIVAKAVAATAAVVASAGAAVAPLAASLAANGVVSVVGVSTAALAAAAVPAAAVAGGFGTIELITKHIASSIQDQVTKEMGMDRLAPGEKKTYGKMSLSLWQQGTCIRTRVNPANKKEILVETMYMRPIFSGPTDNSENVHEIQWWINKWGRFEHTQTIPCS